MKIQLPEHVKQIIHRLQQEGYDAYAVGGCVRDTLLGRSPQDWDITTSAKPQVVKSLFSHTIDTGIAHGTVTVMLDHTGYEVTTYRIDGEYEDARHPKTVTFTGNLVEDLKRRDFTINAMAYNDTAGLVDAFDGIGDLKRHVIRCVGIPHDRFGEDALRMLRAVRFAAQLGFSIEEKTRQAVADLADNDVAKPVCVTTDEKGQNHFKGHPAECAEMARVILRRLKFDNETIKRVCLLVRYHDDRPAVTPRNVRRAVSRIGVENMEALFAVKRADTLAQSMYERQKKLSYIDAYEETYREILKEHQCVQKKDLAINGRDLIAQGMKTGKEMGEVLQALYEQVLDEPQLNNKETLLALALQLQQTKQE